MAFGYQVHIAGAQQKQRLCCGRTHLAVGDLDKAREAATTLCDSLYDYASQQVPIVGLEPSCLLTLRDEHLSLLSGDKPKVVAQHAYLFEEFIAQQLDENALNLPELTPIAAIVKVHGHCHQKAFDLMGSVRQTLSLIPDASVEVIDSGCCGMAGSFGYHTQTETVSRQMAALDLVPSVNAAPADAAIVAAGTSCRHQIADCTERQAIHPARLLRQALAGSTDS